MSSRYFGAFHSLVDHLTRGSHAFAGEFRKIRADVEKAFLTQQSEHSGTTAQRPTSPFLGQIFYNTSLAEEEVWNGTSWHAMTVSAAPTLAGTPGSQTLASIAFQVVATTTNAGTVIVDTGYVPPTNHSAKLDGGINVVDRTAAITTSKNFNASLRNFGGSQVVAGSPVVSGASGDAALSTSTVSFSFSAGTLHITFTPPAAYSGTLDWEMNLTVSEN